jgi:uncharacterized OB-fold protein
MNATISTLPVPESDEANQPYWDAASRGEYVLPQCAECGRIAAPPVSNCRFCLADSFRWSAASGEGTVYSYLEYFKGWSDVWRAHVPYVVAVIDLVEGVRVIASFVEDEEGRRPGVGDRVRVRFQERAGGAGVPVFQLAS